MPRTFRASSRFSIGHAGRCRCIRFPQAGAALVSRSCPADPGAHRVAQMDEQQCPLGQHRTRIGRSCRMGRARRRCRSERTSPWLSGPLPLQDRFTSGGGGGNAVTITDVQKGILRAWSLRRFRRRLGGGENGCRDATRFDIGPLHFTVGRGFFRYRGRLPFQGCFELQRAVPAQILAGSWSFYRAVVKLPLAIRLSSVQGIAALVALAAPRCRASGVEPEYVQSLGRRHCVTRRSRRQRQADGSIVSASLALCRERQLPSGILVQVEEERDANLPRAGA